VIRLWSASTAYYRLPLFYGARLFSMLLKLRYELNSNPTLSASSFVLLYLT